MGSFPFPILCSSLISFSKINNDTSILWDIDKLACPYFSCIFFYKGALGIMSFKKNLGDFFKKIGNYFDSDPGVQSLKGCAKCELAKVGSSILQDSIAAFEKSIDDAQLNANKIIADVATKIKATLTEAETKISNDVQKACNECQNPGTNPTNTTGTNPTTK